MCLIEGRHLETEQEHEEVWIVDVPEIHLPSDVSQSKIGFN